MKSVVFCLVLLVGFETHAQCCNNTTNFDTKPPEPKPQEAIVPIKISKNEGKMGKMQSLIRDWKKSGRVNIKDIQEETTNLLDISTMTIRKVLRKHDYDPGKINKMTYSFKVSILGYTVRHFLEFTDGRIEGIENIRRAGDVKVYDNRDGTFHLIVPTIFDKLKMEINYSFKELSGFQGSIKGTIENVHLKLELIVNYKSKIVTTRAIAQLIEDKNLKFDASHNGLISKMIADSEFKQYFLLELTKEISSIVNVMVQDLATIYNRKIKRVLMIS